MKIPIHGLSSEKKNKNKSKRNKPWQQKEDEEGEEKNSNHPITQLAESLFFTRGTIKLTNVLHNVKHIAFLLLNSDDIFAFFSFSLNSIMCFLIILYGICV